MKTIGLLGGMSWESSIEYYRLINEEIRKKLGGLSSARCVLFSFNFREIEELQRLDKWKELSNILSDAAIKLEKIGAELLLICTNTMHKVADDIQRSVNIPLLNIIDVTAEKILEDKIKKVGLLGTRFTMEDEFFVGRLDKKFGIKAIVPSEQERQVVHDIIYQELCKGIRRESSKGKLLEIINKLTERGAEGIILGCTELPLLVTEGDTKIKIYNTTKIHALAAVEYALGIGDGS